MPHCFRQLPPSQCCCAKEADSRLEPLQIHLWRFALHTGLHWPNNSALLHCFWQNAMLSAAVQNRLTAGLFCCKYTYGNLLIIQVCNGPTQMQCHTAFGKMQCSLLSAAVHNRLTAGSFCCKNTYGDVLLIQVCSGPTPVQCHTAFGKMQCSVLLCKTG